MFGFRSEVSSRGPKAVTLGVESGGIVSKVNKEEWVEVITVKSVNSFKIEF